MIISIMVVVVVVVVLATGALNTPWKTQNAKVHYHGEVDLTYNNA